MTQFTAVFEGGLLRPTEPLAIAEGARLQVFIVTPTTHAGTSSPAEILDRIAALPTAGGDPTTSRDHDKVLYDSGNSKE
jgi:hypothetical protein